ncbi:MAG: CxxC-x17-CxxC domain-containing protein [Patescibacteria group bacterium]|jgi:CxxC-x17-CxxC domain-containing protein
MNSPFQRNTRGKRSDGDRFSSDKPWKKSFGDRDGARPALHPAVCSKCGQDCVVPFKPNGKKPIFCSNCFKKEEGADDNRFSRPSTGRPYRDEDRGGREDSLGWQLKTINSKLDTILNLLESDTYEEPKLDKPKFRKR